MYDAMPPPRAGSGAYDSLPPPRTGSGVPEPRQRPGSGVYDSPPPHRTGSGAVSPAHRHIRSSAVEPFERTAARTIAGAIDALIRAQRLQTNVQAVAARTRDLLVEPPLFTLGIGVNALHVGTELGLETDQDHGRWLLPAFMAGLRTLTPQEELQPEELQRLAAALSTLRFDPESLAHFADWLWSDGLDGFDLELHAGFSELLDTAADPGLAQREIAALRADLASAMADQVETALRELNRTGVSPAAQVSLETYAAEARSGHWDLEPEDAASLRFSAESAAFWARQEITLALLQPAMRTATSPESLAKGLVKVAAEDFESSFLPLLAALSQHADPYVKQILGALEREPVGAVIAERAPLDEAGRSRLVALLTSSMPSIAAGIAAGLCVRCADDPQTGPAVAEVVREVGPQRYAAMLQPEALGSRACLAASAVLLQAHANVADLRPFLAVVTPSEALGLLGALPGGLWQALPQQLVAWLDLATGDERERLVETGLHRAPQTFLPAAVASIVAAKGEGWTRTLLLRVGRAAVGEKVARPLYNLYRTGATSLEVRLTLLDLLAPCPESGKDVLKWRFAELVEHDAIRSRLAELRSERKRK